MTSEKHDWSAVDALTEAEIHAAAMSDRDARPLTEEQMARVRLSPRIKIIRQTLRLSYEAFSERYQIPVETLRAWEERRAEPTPGERSYLEVIARAPDVVRQALEPRVSEPV